MRNERKYVAAFLMVVASMAGVAVAQQGGQNARQQAPNGVVVAADATSLVLLDRTGTQATFKLTADTVYQLGRAVSTLQETAKPGMRVRITVGPDGAVQLVNSSGFTSQLNGSQLKILLALNDQEWALLGPKFERIQMLATLAADPGLGNGYGNGNNNNNGQPAGNVAGEERAVESADAALRTNFYSKDATGAELADSVKAFRAAKAQAREDLAAARKELTDLVTPRQEALLVAVGILQ